MEHALLLALVMSVNVSEVGVGNVAKSLKHSTVHKNHVKMMANVLHLLAIFSAFVLKVIFCFAICNIYYNIYL